MATEFKLNYTGSEINRKLADVDVIKADLENSYYTSAEIDIKFTENDGKFDEVNESINTKIGEVNSSIDTKIGEVNTSLTFKADLIEGKVPAEQIPEGIVDLSDYYTKTEVDEEINSTKEGFNAELTFKADLVDGKIPASQLPDDIGGEVAWEDIKNKPFGKTGWEYTWDGNTEGLEVISVAGGFLNFYKVSSDFIERSEIIGASYEMYFDSKNNTGVIDEAFISDGTNGSYVVLFNGSTPVILVTVGAGTETVMGMEVEIPSVGVWLPYFSEEEYPSYVGKGEIKKIDKEFLPDDIGANVDLSDYYTKNEIDLSLSEKADLIDGKIPVSQIPDDIGGGVSSWNDLEDKPFGETGLKYEWDGETSDKEHLAIIDGFDFYRISSDILTDDELIGITAKMYFDGEFIEGEISQNGDIVPVQTASGNLVVMYGGQLPVCLIASQAGEDNFMGITFSIPSTGVWFFHGAGEEEYTHYLQKDYEIKKIDKEYLPDDIGGGVTSWNDLIDKPFGEEGFKLEWDGNTESALNVLPLDGTGLILYQVSEDFVFSEDVIGAIVGFESDESNTFTVDENIITRFDSGNTDSFMLMYNSFPWIYNIVEAETISAMGMSVDFPSAGIWFTSVDGASVYTTLFDNYSLKKIDKKFLPDDIGNGGGNVNVDLSNYYTKTQVDSIASAIEGKITSTFCYKGTVDNYTDLPTENNTVGDVWNIANADPSNDIEAGDNVAWSGTGWDVLAGIMDLSGYYTKEETDSLIDNVDVDLSNYYTKSEINNIALTGSPIVDCPTYTGGSFLDASSLMIFNYYKVINSLTADYTKINIDDGIYDINTNEFVITFKAMLNVASNSNIVINIATGHSSTGLGDYDSLNNYTSDLSVELQDVTEFKKNSWYTAYCVYNETQGKMVGYLISTDVDTSSLQTKGNLVTSIDENSTNQQYPSAKLLYDIIGDLYDVIGDCDTVLDEINALIGE